MITGEELSTLDHSLTVVGASVPVMVSGRELRLLRKHLSKYVSGKKLRLLRKLLSKTDEASDTVEKTIKTARLANKCDATKGVVDDALPSRPLKTVYHQGDLKGGVSGNRPLSTSPDPDLGHYHPNGELYRFDIPADVYDQWILDRSIQPFNDLHLPSGQIRPEIRIMPPVSGRMNDFLVPPGGG